MATTRFEIGEVTVTVEHPDSLPIRASLNFFTGEAEHEAVIASLGGVGELDPINPTRGWVTRSTTVGGQSLKATVFLPGADRTYNHPIAAALLAAQQAP